MIKTFLRAEDIDRSQWSHLAETSRVTSFFQTPECYCFYNSLSFMQTFAFGVSEDEQLKGIMVGFIQADGGKIKQYFSRRAIVNGGLLLADDISDEAVGQLLRTAQKELKKKVIYIELRNLNDYSCWQSVFQDNGFCYEEHLGYIVPTPSEDEVLMRMEKRRRQTIRAAFREGVEVDSNPTIDDVHAFYAILENMYKNRIKQPLYPLEFFEKLIEHPFGRIFTIKCNGKIIGGQVSMLQKGKTIYDIYLAGLDREYRKQAPSTIGTYSSMQYAANNGYQMVDLMGAGKLCEKYGVRDFKESFRGELVSYGRNKYICNPLLYKIGCLGVKIMKWL